MPQLIIGALVIWLAIVVVTYAIQVAYYAAGPTLLGWVTFLVVRATIRTTVASAVESRLKDLVGLKTVDGKLAFEVKDNPELLVPYNDRQLMVSGLAAYCALGLLFYYFTQQGYFAGITSGSSFPTQVTNFIGFGLSAAGLAAGISFSHKKSSHGLHVRSILSDRIQSLNSQAAAAIQFDELVQRNNELRKSLKAPLDSPGEALTSDVQRQLSAIIDGSTTLQALIDAHCIKVQDENKQLTQAADSNVTLMHAYDEACILANRAGNNAVLHYLDLVSRAIETLQQLVVQRRWTELHEQLAGATNELRQIIENAESVSQEEAYDQDATNAEDIPLDPYEVLGVRNDLSNEEVLYAYRSLANIYHPDKNRVTDDRKFKEIKDAYDKIRQERGIK